MGPAHAYVLEISPLPDRSAFSARIVLASSSRDALCGRGMIDAGTSKLRWGLVLGQPSSALSVRMSHRQTEEAAGSVLDRSVETPVEPRRRLRSKSLVLDWQLP